MTTCEGEPLKDSLSEPQPRMSAAAAEGRSSHPSRIGPSSDFDHKRFAVKAERIPGDAQTRVLGPKNHLKLDLAITYFGRMNFSHLGVPPRARDRAEEAKLG
jgi:hypothetical protein